MPEPLPDDAPMSDMLELRNRQIAAVHQISRVLSSSLDLDDRLSDIMRISMQAADAIAGTIFLYRPADDKLVFRLVVGEKADELTGIAIPADRGVAGAVFRSGQPRIDNDPTASGVHDEDTDAKVGFSTQKMITLPLKYQAGRPVGVMQVLNKQHGIFDNNDLEVLEIVGAIAATAIENAQLHQDSQLSAVAHAVGDLSHDIKNKVAPISGWIDTLDPMLKEMLSEVDAAIAQMPQDRSHTPTTAIDDFRQFCPEGFDAIRDQVLEVQEFTKLIADAVKGIVTEPQLDPHELGPIIEKQLASLEQKARAGGVWIVRNLEPVPVCRFDRFFIERAVYNLVNNALTETPDGGSVTVSTSFMAGGQFPAGDFVQIEITDTGRGMPPNVLERILRGDAKSTKPGGTGLGTKIVFNAVAAHHGLFDGSSEEGRGTTFRIKIPYLPG